MVNLKTALGVNFRVGAEQEEVSDLRPQNQLPLPASPFPLPAPEANARCTISWASV
jgi:hypothetical protein